MSHVTIMIKTDNAAFDPDWESEVSRILRKASDKLDRDHEGGFLLRDYNGNKVGSLEVFSDD